MAEITLPREVIKELNDEYIRIELPDELLLISYADLEIIKSTCGLLKNRKKKLLRYLEQSRSEWDRL